MRTLVMGAGAMGSVVGGFMAKAGHSVTLAGRQAHMNAIAHHGLRITGIWGDHHVISLDARTNLDGLKVGDFDLILITVKSYDTKTAVEAVRPLVDADTLVCSYQNGLGNAETIADAVGWHRTVGARVIYGVWLPDPGCAEVTVIAAPTALGVYTGDAPAGRVQQIAEAMNAAGIPTVYTDKVATLLWAKVAYNAALNPLSALLDVPYGALLETENTRAIMTDVVEELYAVAEAMRAPVEPESSEAYVDLLFNALIPPTAAHYASMREDLRRGRRTEIDAINGAICRYGRDYGLSCPANTLLTRLIHARESGRNSGAAKDNAVAST